MKTSLHDNYSSHHQKCICQVCNCGQHKCSHLTGNNSRTSQVNPYAGHPSKKSDTQRKHYQPDSLPYNTDRFGSESKKQFVGDKSHKRSSSVFERNASNIIQHGSFEGQSSYNNSFKEYGGNYGDLRASVLKRQGIYLEGKFDGQSHYSQNYTGKVSPLTKMVEKKTNIDLGSGKFDGQSTYNKNFIGVSEMPPGMVIKKDNIQVGNGRLQNDTSYKLNYSGVRGLPAQKAKSRDSLKPSGDFNGQSTYSHNYLGANGSPSFKVVMKGELGLNEGKIDSQTTYAKNYDYKGTGRTLTERPKSRKDLLKNDNKNYNQSTSYTIQYKAGIADRPQKVIHPSEIVIGSGKPFQGRSLYHQSYKEANQPKNIAKPPAPNGVLPNGNFQGNSTYTNHYNDVNGLPSQLIKHKDTPLNDGGFSGNSTYVEHFSGNNPQRNYCPVNNMNLPKGNLLDRQHLKYNAQLGIWI